MIWIDNTCLILTITMFFWCLTKILAELFADQKLFPQTSTYQRRWLRCGTDCCPRPRQEGGCWECLVVDLLLSTHPLLLSCILYFPSHLLLKKGNGEKVNQTFINLTEIVCMRFVSLESLKREKNKRWHPCFGSDIPLNPTLSKRCCSLTNKFIPKHEFLFLVKPHFLTKHVLYCTELQCLVFLVLASAGHFLHIVRDWPRLG